jgi:hypothetical protein
MFGDIRFLRNYNMLVGDSGFGRAAGKRIGTAALLPFVHGNTCRRRKLHIF